jgi:hypothetical protein
MPVNIFDAKNSSPSQQAKVAQITTNHLDSASTAARNRGPVVNGYGMLARALYSRCLDLLEPLAAYQFVYDSRIAPPLPTVFGN